MVSGEGSEDVSVLCEERCILEVVSNDLRLYVGVESEQTQVEQSNARGGGDGRKISPIVWGM